MHEVNRLSSNDQRVASMIVADLNEPNCEELHMTFNMGTRIENPADFILYLSRYKIGVRHERRVVIVDGKEMTSGVSIFFKV
jgi:hypothetical protein